MSPARYLLCFEIPFTSGHIAGHAFVTFDHGLTEEALEATADNFVADARKEHPDLLISSLVWRSVTRLEEYRP